MLYVMENLEENLELENTNNTHLMQSPGVQSASYIIRPQKEIPKVIFFDGIPLQILSV